MTLEHVFDLASLYGLQIERSGPHSWLIWSPDADEGDNLMISVDDSGQPWVSDPDIVAGTAHEELIQAGWSDDQIVTHCVGKYAHRYHHVA